MCLGKEVPLNSVDTDMTSIVIHTRLPKRTCNGSQPFLPRDDGTVAGQNPPGSSVSTTRGAGKPTLPPMEPRDL
jgi:hypothetical protein